MTTHGPNSLKCQMGALTALGLLLSLSSSQAQTAIQMNVDASVVTGTMAPIWRDHYENHLMFGYGGNPSILGPHTSIVEDPAFASEMARVQPRFIRVSIGRADNPPNTDYYSMDPAVLKNLPYEFYKGGNSLAAANELGNYDFSFLDSTINLVRSIGAEPFITMDYMPFTLSSDTTPEYQAAMGLIYNLAYDNTIRNSPPANNAVYGRVMYHLIKHCYDTFGVTYFEHWNEPDQQWLNPIMVKFFWKGDENQLFAAYKAIADELSADPALATSVKLGGCSFAFYSLANLIPIRFLQFVQTNATKFDFLSFHPYSDTQFRGGYDSVKVALATQWRDTYVPSAELINGEWGRLDVTTDTWGSLDYGLYKVEHIIDMLDRDVAMSFEVALFDQETTSDNNTYLGMYRVGPIVPKPAAFVFFNMNRMNGTLNRLQLSINSGMYALAGMNDAQDKLVVVLPAPNPGSGNNTVELNVSNLPWGQADYHVERFELTDAAYQQGVVSDATLSVTGSGGTYTDSFSTPAVNGNGRLILWEISAGALSVGTTEVGSDRFSIHPNPASDRVTLQFPGAGSGKYTISIVNALGAQVHFEEVRNSDERHTIPLDLDNGLYVVQVLRDGELLTEKILIER